MSSYNSLKKALETFDCDSNEQLTKIDEVFQKIVIENQSDLIRSLDLMEDFLVKTLDQKSLKKSA